MSIISKFTPPTSLPERIFDDPWVNPKTGHLVNWTVKQFLQKIGAPVNVPTQSIGVHADRLLLDPSKVVAGSTYVENDRSNITYVARNGLWNYLGGVLQVPQSKLPTDLTVNDTGLLAEVTDFNHVLQWTGTAWNWGPGDSHSGFLVAFVNAPPDTGWEPADGASNVPQLQSDGSFALVTVPNIPGSYFRT